MTAADAAAGVELAAAAETLLSLLDPDGVQAGKYAGMRVRDNQGVVIGDGNQVRNEFYQHLHPATMLAAAAQVEVITGTATDAVFTGRDTPVQALLAVLDPATAGGPRRAGPVVPPAFAAGLPGAA
ncbi:hypothetical protein [Actinokineospora sp. NBRC 105648]|uniref:hypothetical protein n=1 Tax=Actinokineospora sp. NBRC 105648 TaxID=3032206 RepID=UPI00255716AF|nr:hypothetical protein [Actinokineospora sp. NBRC 105648]